MGTNRGSGGWRWAVVTTTLAGGAWGVDFDLREALRLADVASPDNVAAQARVEAASGRNLSAYSAFVPVLRAELGAMATDEPLSAFGTRLGQRRVSMASFDPAALNDPEAAVAWTSALVAEVPLVNPDAWSGKIASSRELDAARLWREHRRAANRAEVVETWFSLGLALTAVSALEQALSAAKVWEADAASARRNELATRSDVLRAQVEASGIEADLSRARLEQQLVTGRLALLLGLEELPGEVPAMDVPDSVLEHHALSVGPRRSALDAQALEARTEAAAANLDRTRLAFLPRLNGVARWDWKGRESPWENDPSWTMGVQASWSLLRGTSDWGEERVARGQWREAQVGLAATRARQRLELASERRNLESLVGRLGLARRSVEQAAEARRIAELRHREGLASLAERIDAGTLETRMRLGRVAVRREIIGSLARVVLLEGRDPSELAALAP